MGGRSYGPLQGLGMMEDSGVVRGWHMMFIPEYVLTRHVDFHFHCSTPFTRASFKPLDVVKGNAEID